MDYFKIWAVVQDGLVVNRLVGEQAEVNEVARAIYGLDAMCICISDPVFPVEIGDEYRGNHFYHDGVIVVSYPNQSDTIDALQSNLRTANITISRLNEALGDVITTILEDKR